MQSTTNETTQQLLQSQTNAENPNNSNYSDEPVIYEQIPDTPFYLTGNEYIGYRASLGKVLISEPKETKELLIEWIQQKPYEFIMCLINLTIDLREMVKGQSQTKL